MRRRRRCVRSPSTRCCRSSPTATPTRAAPIASPARPAGRSTTPVTGSPRSSDAFRVRSCSRAAVPRATTLRSPEPCGATEGYRVCPATEHHGVLNVVERHHGRVVGVDQYGRADLEQLEAAHRRRRVDRLGDGGQQRGRLDQRSRRRRRRRARRCAERVAAHRCRAGGVLARPPPAVAARRPAVAERPQVRRAEGRRCARRPQGRHHRPACSSAAARSATAGVGPTTCRESWRWPLPSRHRRRASSRSACASRSCAIGSSAVCSSAVDGVRETVPADVKVAGGAHVCVDGRRERVAAVPPRRGRRLCASAASACASGAMEPSHVLAAMGVDGSWSAGALRMTLGRTTTEADVDRAVDILAAAISTLRARSAPAPQPAGRR